MNTIYILMLNQIGHDAVIHSVWDNMEDVYKQKSMLLKSGYTGVTILGIEGTIPQNGQYYL